MKFIEKPYMPENAVKLAVVDGRVPECMEEGLAALGIEAVKTAAHPALYRAVAFHPDMMLHHLGGQDIVHAPGTCSELLAALSARGFRLIEGETVLGSTYPANIAYNVARVGNVAFHNTRYTDGVIKRELAMRGVELVNVRQGYSKCSVCIVDRSSIITSDTGIAMAAEKKGIDVLLTGPDRNIRLEGLDYGFIGGSTGLLGCGRLGIAGKFEKLESNERIRKFLYVKNISIVSLADCEVFDIGSVVPLLQA